MTNSLLVLPFHNLGYSEEDNYLSDGITEELIAMLTKVKDLRVSSRTSSFYFKGKHYSLKEIREQLSVTHVLEGSLRKQDENIRITVHLTDLQTGFTVWSEIYEQTYDDLLSLQIEIAKKITLKFDTALPKKTETNVMSLVPNNDMEAYDLYLKGLYYYNQYTMDKIAKGVAYFQKTVELQPAFALAYSGLSNCYLGLGGYVHPSNYRLAKEAAIKALSLDDGLAAAHLSLASVRMFFDWDWEGGGKSIQKALKLDKESADIYRALAIWHMATGSVEKSITSHKLSVEYDPLNTIYINGLGWSYSYAGQYEKAIEAYKKTLEIDPDFRPSIERIGIIYAIQGKWKEAIYHLQQYQRMVGHPLKGWCWLGYAYGKNGDVEEAYDVLQRLDERKAINKKEQLGLDYALTYLGLGDHDKAFLYLNNGIDNHHILCLATLLLDPVFDEIRADDRFYRLLKKIGLDRYLPKNNKVLDNTSEVLSIQSDTKEHLEVITDHLLYIEAEGNYTKFVWLEAGYLKEKMLRIKLSKTKELIKSETVIHTHRSYLVNISHFKTLQKNGRQHYLSFPTQNLLIPVSRDKVVEVKNVLSKFV